MIKLIIWFLHLSLSTYAVLEKETGVTSELIIYTACISLAEDIKTNCKENNTFKTVKEPATCLL